MSTADSIWGIDIGERPPSTRQCPECGNWYRKSLDNCPNCEGYQNKALEKCPKCGRSYRGREYDCIYCQHGPHTGLI